MPDADEELKHATLGTLRWDAVCSWWIGDLACAGRGDVELVIDAGDDDPRAFLERAAGLLLQTVAAEESVRENAVDTNILEIYETWRHEPEPMLTAQQLARRLELTWVRIDSAVPVTLSYALGDVFGGHTVDVAVDEHLRIKGVDLVG
jgi:hypothetical protein